MVLEPDAGQSISRILQSEPGLGKLLYGFGDIGESSPRLIDDLADVHLATHHQRPKDRQPGRVAEQAEVRLPVIGAARRDMRLRGGTAAGAHLILQRYVRKP
jgi:hypothetical protein